MLTMHLSSSQTFVCVIVFKTTFLKSIFKDEYILNPVNLNHPSPENLKHFCLCHVYENVLN